MTIDEGSSIARTVHLMPKMLMYFDVIKARGFKDDLSEFLNSIISTFFEVLKFFIIVSLETTAAFSYGNGFFYPRHRN